MSLDRSRASFRCVVALGALWVTAPALHAQFPGGGLPDLPAPCGVECFGAAAEAVAQCRADGGSLWDCLGAYQEALAACRAEAGCDDPNAWPTKC